MYPMYTLIHITTYEYNGSAGLAVVALSVAERPNFVLAWDRWKLFAPPPCLWSVRRCYSNGCNVERKSTSSFKVSTCQLVRLTKAALAFFYKHTLCLTNTAHNSLDTTALTKRLKRTRGKQRLELLPLASRVPIM
jgi:hypothetical protein